MHNSGEIYSASIEETPINQPAQLPVGERLDHEEAMERQRQEGGGLVVCNPIDSYAEVESRTFPVQPRKIDQYGRRLNPDGTLYDKVENEAKLIKAAKALGVDLDD